MHTLPAAVLLKGLFAWDDTHTMSGISVVSLAAWMYP